MGLKDESSFLQIRFTQHDLSQIFYPLKLKKIILLL